MRHRVEYEVTLEGAPAEKGTAFAAPGKPLVVERKAP
jgi:hypothetical protein